MNAYFVVALNWLGAYKVPVVLLSATLPFQTKMDLIEAYMSGYCNSLEDPDPTHMLQAFNQSFLELQENPIVGAYPLVTYSDNTALKTVSSNSSSPPVQVKTQYLDDEEIVPILQSLLSEGGCAGVVMDTVARSQNVYEKLRDAYRNEIESGKIQIKLFHSRFIASDRMKQEQKLVEQLGKDATLANGERPKKMIAVGTQVLEQSLDLDFDVLVSDIAPIDLMLQRMGRLHRHLRSDRPKMLQDPQVFVTGISDKNTYKFTTGIDLIYQKFFLMRTVDELPDTVIIPDQVPILVDRVYDTERFSKENNISAEYQRELDEVKKNQALKRGKVDQDRIARAQFIDSVVNLNNINPEDQSEPKLLAKVRDSAENLEVILLQKNREEISLLPWIGDDETGFGAIIPPMETPGFAMGRMIKQSSVSLPRSLTNNWAICKVVDFLEKQMIDSHRFDTWHDSSWLRGELVLTLDENLRAIIEFENTTFDISYTQDVGLRVDSTRKDIK
jgi:CRISPR-associated endonuclease/helicase Cas3